MAIRVFFLLLVGIGVPFAAWRSAKRLPPSGILRIRREVLFAQVMITHVVLFTVASLAARESGIALWTVPPRPEIAWPAAAVLVVAMIAVLRLRWRTKSELDKARLVSLLPRDRRELVPYVGVCITAGIAEEIVYRGVFTGVLATMIPISYAALVSAIAFGLAHLIQGRRAVISIVAIGLIMQAFVAVAGSLVPAMVVHALYDLIAGILIPRWIAEERVAAPAG